MLPDSGNEHGCNFQKGVYGKSHVAIISSTPFAIVQTMRCIFHLIELLLELVPIWYSIGIW